MTFEEAQKLRPGDVVTYTDDGQSCGIVGDPPMKDDHIHFFVWGGYFDGDPSQMMDRSRWVEERSYNRGAMRYKECELRPDSDQIAAYWAVALMLDGSNR